VTAQDFVFAWRKAVDPATASQYAFIMYPINNAEAINKGKLPVTALGVRAVDDRTLRVEFEWGGSGEGVLTAKSTWQSPATRMSGGVITGSGETRAQEFLSAFDNMSRPRIDEKKYSFSVDVRTAGPDGR